MKRNKDKTLLTFDAAHMNEVKAAAMERAAKNT